MPTKVTTYLNVRIPEDLLRRIRQESARRGPPTTMSSIAEKAISEALDQLEKEPMPWQAES